MTYKCLDTGDDFEIPIVNLVPPGWTRVVEVDLTNGDECPAPWRKIEVNNVYMCRSPSDQRGCYILHHFLPMEHNILRFMAW